LRLDIQSAHARQAYVQQDTAGLECLCSGQKYAWMVEGDRLEVRRTQQAF
jgi:hypothetical protein